MPKSTITLDVLKDAIIPHIKLTPGKDAVQEIIAHLNTKAIEVVDENGEPIDLTGTLVIAPAVKAEEDPDAEVEEDEEMKAAAEAEAKRLEASITKSVKDAIAEEMKTMRTKRPQVVVERAETKFVIPAEVKRFVVKNFKGKQMHPVAGVELSPDQRAFRFGIWSLLNVAKSIPAMADAFPRAAKWAETNGISLKAVHAEGSNALGGHLVPEEFGNDLIDLREQYGIVRRLFKVRPMSSDTRSDPRRTGGLTAYFVGEKGAGTESNKGWDRVQLTAKKLMALSRYTAELNEDAVMSIGDDLAGEIAYAFANKEDECGVNGDGTSTYGGIVGLRQKLEDVNGVDDGGGIVLGTGNAWSELTLADFNNVVARLPQFADTPNTKWLVHRSFYFGTMQKLELAAGGVVSTEIRDGNRSNFRFLGYPVEISQVMPSTEGNSEVCAMLGDYSLAASFGDRRQEAISFSEHATIGGENVFERDEIAIRGTQRFDINVHDVGSATVAGPVVGLMTAAS